jgi:ubiquitin carboxyl-terminal hydrolase 20/33
VWCYECNRETHVPVAARYREKAALVRDLIDNQKASTFGPSIRPPNPDTDEYVAKAPDPVESNPFAPDSSSRQAHAPAGLVGFSNLGNTCYLNSALQCLSNVPSLTEFFLTCSPLVTKADVFNGVQREKPSLSKAYLQLVRDVWDNSPKGQRKEDSHQYVAPTKLLFAFKAIHPMFRGYHQQDAQEFLRCFMDQLHEELMEPVNELDYDGTGDENEGGSNLDSVSEAGSNAANSQDDEDEEQEYETADSGVSEEGSNNSSTAPLLTSTSKSHNRKRKHSSHAAAHDERSGDGRSKLVSTGVQEDEQLIPSSDGELEFADAASSRSASPPTTNSFLRSPPHLVSSPKSPGKTAPPPVSVIQKRKIKTYRSVITDIFDGKLVSSVQCLTCDRVSTTTETFQVHTHGFPNKFYP